MEKVETKQPVQQRGVLEEPPVLSLRKVRKTYGSINALVEVDLELRRGEIHAVLGENGAGKSTLIKIITGIIEKTDGEIEANGAKVEIGTPQNARRLGITAVPQEVLLVPELPVGRNILLGIEGRTLVRKDKLNASECAIVQKALDIVGANFGPQVPTRQLAVPQLRLAQIARALIQEGTVLILDEPTAVLSEPDAEHLLERLERLRDAGKSIIYITHRLSEVMRIADRATILRDGRKVGLVERSEFDRAKLVELMTKTTQQAAPSQVAGKARPRSAIGEVVLQVQDLSCGHHFSDVSFEARAGQIIGIAGVQGSGHGHVLRTIAGVDSRTQGAVNVRASSVRPGNVQDTYKTGLRLVPADRRGEGIVASLSNQENIAISPGASKTSARFGFRSLKAEREIAAKHVDALSVHPRSVSILTGNLSGGNQQKIVLARAICEDLEILLAEEPTQGIDVRSRAEIHQLLRRIASDHGCAVVIASSEFDELIGLADIIHVMCLGKLVATLPGEGVTYREVLHHALP